MSKTIYTFQGTSGTYFVTDLADPYPDMSCPGLDAAFAFTDGRGSTGYAAPREPMVEGSLDAALRLLVGDK